ncbi:DUF929 domain-containing protein [Metallosphaera hakonensis]|uniref:DUF929 domain-containing protein n=1 Tax=Metallosphaera hakonensis JCM 8857 = DSM 7519 TaxID=1293036 RepID=A0A2U9ISV2_9CREN|nr:DUF929 domain-containing protein [Metallosphaera hakonensis]AWR99141.1 DUF929 domain-containing protein [Metallosphaera hakonensis JCM 8857 = DSM 7519]
MNRRLLGVFVTLVLLVGLVIFMFSKTDVIGAQSVPPGRFVKVSNQDLAPTGRIIVVEQSWIGCPVGAAASWAIYNALRNYGNFSFELHYSDPLHSPANIPGLLFKGFNSTSILNFYVAYVYNQYLNASYNGTPIPQSELVQAGEQILQSQYSDMGLSPQVSQLILKYETQVPVTTYGKPSAFYVTPPHLNFAILISGPGGTYIITTPIINPEILSEYTPQYVLTHLDQFPQIIQASQLLQNVTLEAAGNLASECPT